MKVLVTGSRDWTNQGMIEDAIVASEATIVVHGGARGADRLAGQVCKDLDLEERIYPAHWDRYGKPAGTNRNLQMLKEENTLDSPLDCVLAFPLPTSIGTCHMIRIARAANVPVTIIEMPTEVCATCGKLITDSEWVVNWTSCAECFDKGFQEYLDKEKDATETVESVRKL